MAVRIPIHTLITLFSFSFFAAHHFEFATSDEPPMPSFAFSWSDDKDTFQAGDTAAIKVKVLGNFGSNGNKSAFSPTLTVNGKTGNSCFISGVRSDFGDDGNNWRISFVPILSGLFSVIINDDHFRVLDSSLHFTALPGQMYPSASVASWKGLVNEFIAGAKATVLILPKDAFGNNISTNSKEPNSSIFEVSAFYGNGSSANMLNVTFLGWNKFGYVSIELKMFTTGTFLLHVVGGNQTLNGSPLPFKVNPGPLDVSHCLAKWRFDTNVLQIFSKMEIFIHQLDQYGNLVPGLNEFDAEVVEKETNLSIPIADLHFVEVVPGIQLFSFSASEPGNFMLTIYDMGQNKSISNMPYDYTVYVGYCDGSSSMVNGSGLDSSVAGEMAKFSVYLNDIYQYPSPVELERLRLQIVRKLDSLVVLPSIHPILVLNGSEQSGELRYGVISDMEIASAPLIDPNNIFVGNPQKLTSAFDVTYTPIKSGIYDIHVYCGNVPLNGGRSFTKEVRAGNVNVSLSGFVKYASKVPKLIENEIVVQLVDSFNNSVFLQQSRLKLEIASINTSAFSSWMFMDNNDGSYISHYVPKEVGTYNICASFDDKHFSPCPLGVNVYSSEYFPKAYNDTISVWEDESIAFDVLANDYFSGGNASITEFSKPRHGSLLQCGELFRYTPYKDFYGDDYFSYTISDVNGNLDTAAVNISVLITPPQFVSFPSQLQAIEDVISPRFGGFSGFEMRYSDLMENISVILSAQSGSVFLSPMLMQFWQSMWSGLSVKKGDGKAKDLILEGPVEVINFALQSIQYFGNENFYGNDIIRVSTTNRNGMNDLNVSVSVEPINDPPFIRVPEFIILKKNNGDGSLIFDRQKDKFEFSIWDPDLPNFPGGESRFMVTLSLEVNSGILVTNLPAELIHTTELKLKNMYQWQPLQTFVTISKHFMVKAKGVRFRGTVKDCNSVMEQLFYDGGEHGAVLTVTVNDMGNYGCYPGSAENISMPLFSEATVNLIRRSPMSSLAAYTLGSAIVIEFLMMLSLGAILLFFTCKCAIVLVHERRSRDIGNNKLSKVPSSHKQPPNTSLSEDATCFTGWCPSPFFHSSHPSDFQRRSRLESGNIQTGKNDVCSDHSQQTPLPSLVPLAIEKGQSRTI
ncbi:protein GAMETE EXPRESSED 2 [Malania oleifera]|uniref:protein GAMETE EXPRESSED 2 n=1 Tax=Malania oleifera TaxID=397392 RepID=UPI0025AE58A7|nr:protein GAMETE EXPRESSED 2 [Malania oleifera]